jgi:hypothetical protein
MAISLGAKTSGCSSHTHVRGFSGAISKTLPDATRMPSTCKDASTDRRYSRFSDKEARAIERFLDRGGAVYAGEEAGRMDERCHWRREPLWRSGRKGLFRRGPGEVGIIRSSRPTANRRSGISAPHASPVSSPKRPYGSRHRRPAP